jgi:broad specificity phosphatase PhoE
MGSFFSSNKKKKNKKDSDESNLSDESVEVDSSEISLDESTKETKNILLVSHNARMRCLLEDVIKNKMNYYKEKFNVKEIRFKNTAVLLIKIINNKAILSLAYEGNVNKPKKGAYFVNTDISSPSDKVSFVKFEDININIKKLVKLPINYNYNIYVARHGEATHNTAMLNLYRDTSLTSDGKKQSSNVYEFILNNNINIDHVFSSNLKRTRQTASYIKNDNIKTDKIIVLPCAHELAYNKNGQCDLNAANKFVPPENLSSCSEKSDTGCKLDDDCCRTSKGNLIIDWSYYDQFKRRNESCTTTNMIQLIVTYCEEYVKNNQYGGQKFNYTDKYQKYKMKFLIK